jgi:hypothetical protein
MSKWLNTIGLILGIVGVVLLFIWGPPQQSFEQGASIGLEDNTKLQDGKTVAQHNEEVAARENRHKCMSRIGLFFIGAGFVFQLCSIWIC